MTTFTLTGCHEHPVQLDNDCMTCSVVTSCDMDTTPVGTSDKLNSVYPEIDATVLAGSAAFVTSPKKLTNFQAPVAKMFNSSPKPIVLNTLYISRDFHPGQSEVNEADYPERFSLGEEDYPERLALAPEDLGTQQQHRKLLPTKCRTKKAESAPEPATTPSVPSTAEEQLKQLISKEDLAALVKHYVADQLQSAKSHTSKGTTLNEIVPVTKTPEPQPELEEPELDEDTIVVDVSSSESEDEEPSKSDDLRTASKLRRTNY